MTKRLGKQLEKIQYMNQSLKLNITTIILTVICMFFIVIATFTQFDFNHYVLPFDWFAYFGKNFKDPAVYSHFIKHYRYIPQVPMIMFIAAFLGRRFGIASVLLYIITGLFMAPVFAIGGGLRYVLEYGFGYILAYIPAVFFAGSITRSGLTYINMLQATLVGVCTIHLMGIFYMLFVATIQRETSALILGWISAQSGVKIIYDIVFGFFAMIVAKYLKKWLWFAMS